MRANYERSCTTVPNSLAEKLDLGNMLSRSEARSDSRLSAEFRQIEETRRRDNRDIGEVSQDQQILISSDYVVRGGFDRAADYDLILRIADTDVVTLFRFDY